MVKQHIAQHARIPFLTILLLFLLFSCPAAAETAVNLVPAADSHSLAGHLQLLIDPGGEMDLAAVLKADRDGKFSPLPGFVNLGYTRNTSWLKFSFTRAEGFPKKFFLWLEPSYINHVSVFLQQGESGASAEAYRRYELGDNTPVKDHPLRNPAMVLPLSIDDTGEYRVYIRAQTNSTHGFGGDLITTERLLLRSSMSVLFHGGFIAIALVVGLINLIFALHVKSWTYGYYGLYALSLVPCQGGINGLYALLLPGQMHLLNDAFVGGGTGLGFALFCLFAMRLLETRTTFPRSHRYLQLTAALGFLVAAASTTSWYGNFSRILFLNSFLLIIVVTTVGIRQWRRGLPVGGLYVLAFTLTGLGGVLSFLRTLGFLPVNLLTLNSLEFGTAIHLVWMTMALSLRIRVAEKKAMAAAQGAEERAVELAEGMVKELSGKQKQLETALKAEHDLRNDQSAFIDMVCHEYRTPLSVLQTNLDIVKECLKKSLPVEESRLEKIGGAARRLAEVFSASLKDSFMHHSTFNLKPESIDVADFLCESEQSVKELWGGDTVNFSGHVPENLQLHGDSKLLNMAIFNLIDNAVKYSRPDSQIRLFYQHIDEQLQIEIANDVTTPLPMTSEDLFHKFIRAGRPSSKAGTGVGLYLVRRIIEEHGGSVMMQSPDDMRVVVTVTLPVPSLREQG